MGRDKAHIELGGRLLYKRPLDFLRQHFKTVIIAGDRPDLASEEVPAFADAYPGSALGGLYTALKAAATAWVFVLPCDLPYPDARILQQLLAGRAGADAVVPRTPRGYEPLFALYHRRCLPRMDAMLKAGRYRVTELYPQIRLRTLDWQLLPEGWERGLLNVNTPQQLQQIEEGSA